MNIVITGSTKGLGYALAKKFLELGDSVVISSRSQEHVNKALEKLHFKYSNSKVLGYVCDVNNLENLTALGEFAKQKLGEIDIWVNNAGTKGPEKGKLMEISADSLKEVIDTNLLGLMLGTKVALKNMMKQGHGKIFSVEGLGSNGMASPNSIAYGATKASLPQLLKTLKIETKGTNIRINDISPGMVLTDLLITKADNQAKKIFNILAELPETVADYLVPQMKKVNKSGKNISFLNRFKALFKFMTAWRFKNRWFDEQGNPKFKIE